MNKQIGNVVVKVNRSNEQLMELLCAMDRRGVLFGNLHWLTKDAWTSDEVHVSAATARNFMMEMERRGFATDCEIVSEPA